jgi:hypothetical protein
MEDDGTLRVAGHDTGTRVSDFFGTAITSYEWVYVVPSERVNALLQALGLDRRAVGLAGDTSSDFLHPRFRGQEVLREPGRFTAPAVTSA